MKIMVSVGWGLDDAAHAEQDDKPPAHHDDILPEMGVSFAHPAKTLNCELLCGIRPVRYGRLVFLAVTDEAEKVFVHGGVGWWLSFGEFGLVDAVAFTPPGLADRGDERGQVRMAAVSVFDGCLECLVGPLRSFAGAVHGDDGADGIRETIKGIDECDHVSCRVVVRIRCLGFLLSEVVLGF